MQAKKTLNYHCRSGKDKRDIQMENVPVLPVSVLMHTNDQVEYVCRAVQVRFNENILNNFDRK